jgi:hypothetical protein
VAVLKEGKKPRICLDLSRNLNDHLVIPKLAYESVWSAVRIASQFATPWFAKVDLSNAYLSFPVREQDRVFLRFQWETAIFEFAALPFGLASAPFICTQLLGVVAKALERQGVILVRYLDDFLLIADSKEHCLTMLRTTLRTLIEFGLAANPDKTVAPTRRIEFLGIDLDSNTRTLCCPPRRLEELRACISSCLKQRRLSRVQSQRLLGKLSFASTTLPGARPFLRSLCDATKIHARIRVTVQLRQDLNYWLTRLSDWNGQASWQAHSPDLFMFTDASMEGFGWHVAATSGQTIRAVCGIWSSETAQKIAPETMALAELQTVRMALQDTLNYWKPSCIRVFSDNSATVWAINRWSAGTTLSQELRLLSHLQSTSRCFIHASHIAGENNTLADLLSRPSIHHFSLHTPIIYSSWLQPPTLVAGPASA